MTTYYVHNLIIEYFDPHLTAGTHHRAFWHATFCLCFFFDKGILLDCACSLFAFVFCRQIEKDKTTMYIYQHLHAKSSMMPQKEIRKHLI